MKNLNDIEVKDFIELSPSEEHQRELRIQEAKELLRKEGYFVDNLWHVSDVTMNYECTDEEAYKILKTSLQNESTMEHIWFTISLEAEHINVKKNKI